MCIRDSFHSLRNMEVKRNRCYGLYKHLESLLSIDHCFLLLQSSAVSCKCFQFLFAVSFKCTLPWYPFQGASSLWFYSNIRYPLIQLRLCLTTQVSRYFFTLCKCLFFFFHLDITLIFDLFWPTPVYLSLIHI